MRTNNAAESLHSVIKPKAKGRLSLDRFLAIIEEQMDDARDSIATGCQPECRPAAPDKNRLLSVQLYKLFGGWIGLFNFLDNRGSILSLKNHREVLHFTQREAYVQTDTFWSLDNRYAIVQAARNLYFRLHPTGRLSDDEISQNVADWSLQEIPPAEVPEFDGDESD